MYKALLCSVVCLLCLSCSVGPDYERPLFYNEATIAQELNLQNTASLPCNWYKQFADSQLTGLVEQGLQNSTDVNIAIARLRQARASLQINQADYLPQVGLKGGYNYNKTSKNIGLAADSHYYSAGFDASWELDLWGKGRQQIKADAATLSAAEYTVRDVRLTVAAEVVADYVYLLQNMENLRIAEQNVRLQQDILDTVKTKYQNGLSDETAYSEAQYLLENTKAQLPVYREQIEKYRNALATVVGVIPSELSLKKADAHKLLHKKVEPELNSFPLSVIRLRPDVAAVEQQLIAQNALVGKAVAELYPDISISGLWGYAASGGSKLIRSSSQTYNYAPLLTMPLLDWNKLQNNIELQEHIRQEISENYKQTVLNAIAEIKNAQTSFKQNQIAADRKCAAVTNMQTAAKLTQQKYINGLIEFSEVARTQQNLLSAQQEYIASQAQILQSLVAFYKAIGAPVQ